MKLLLFLTIFVILDGIYGANILFLDPMPSPSINLWNYALAKTLAAKSHNVTVVTTSFKVKPIQNLHVIYLERAFEPLEKFDFSEMTGNVFSTDMACFKFCRASCEEGVLKSKGLEEILSYPDDMKFDLILVDVVCSSCLLPLVHKFRYPPVIGLFGYDMAPYRYSFIGGHDFPAYASFNLYTFDTNMNFWERLKNTLAYNFEHQYRKHFVVPKMDKTLRERYNFKNLPYLGELEQNVSLMLVASDYTFTPPIPRQPNEIFVAGMQIVEPKTLPQDLKSFIESGKKGSVLMSLGTNQRSDALSRDFLIKVIKTFESLPDYNFLWKFESDSLPIEQPKNVKIEKFLPQNDLLAHPNLKAFITHSGSFGTQEALWYGVPCVAMPFFLDQYKNAMKMEKFGVAVIVDKDRLEIGEFRKSILKVLEDPSYQENAQEMSKHFQDQPEKPLERAVWWTEYILRNPDPKHLKSPILKLGNFVANSYDVISFVLVLLVLVMFSVFKCLLGIKGLFGKPTDLKKKQN